VLKEPYALPEGFYWVSMDTTDDLELQVSVVGRFLLCDVHRIALANTHEGNSY